MLPRELKQRDENTKLKRLVADLSLDSVILQEIVPKQLPRAFASWCNDEPTRWPLAPHDRGDQSRQPDRSVLHLSPRHDRPDLVLPMSAGRASQVRKPIKELNDEPERRERARHNLSSGDQEARWSARPTSQSQHPKTAE
jgi:hypothetical protein